MDNEILVKHLDRAVRRGITEGQWEKLETSQKFNWRIALLGLVALSYFMLYAAFDKLMSLGGSPKWFFHVIGTYSSCCFLLLSAGEREYSKLAKWQRNIIDLVWNLGGSLFFLMGGVLFVVVLFSAFYKTIVPQLADTLPKELFPGSIGTAFVSILLLIALYQRFNGILYNCFTIPQNVGRYCKFYASNGTLVPLAKIEMVLAVAFSFGHVFVSCMLSLIFLVWS